MIHRVGTIGPNLHLEHGLSSRPADAFDGNPNASQILSQLPVIDGKIDKFSHPLWRNLH
jgi:hypothetical protein